MSTKLTLEERILKLAKGNPRTLTTLTDFTRFVQTELKTDKTLFALKYHVKKVLDANDLKLTPDLEKTVEEDLDKYRVKHSDSTLGRQYKVLQERYIAVKDQLDEMLSLDEINIAALEVPLTQEALEGQGVPIIQWSDWHVGKTVEASIVNGLNEYNPDIAKARALKLFENTAKMLELHSKHVTMTTGVLHLGGDAIEGYLREHNLRENSMSPIEEVIFASELEITGIEYLLSTGFLTNLVVLMNRGNHPRLTKKMDSDDYRVNLETLLHYNVTKHFRDDKRVHFHAPKGEIGYVEVMDKTIRFFHGHQVKYNGGIGGLTIPLRKAIMGWDETQKADYNLMGHFHQSYKPLSNVMMNGSLCGYDPFAMNVVKAPFQHPLQSMEMLIDGRGFRMFTSIDCE